MCGEDAADAFGSDWARTRLNGGTHLEIAREERISRYRAERVLDSVAFAPVGPVRRV